MLEPWGQPDSIYLKYMYILGNSQNQVWKNTQQANISGYLFGRHPEVRIGGEFARFNK